MSSHSLDSSTWLSSSCLPARAVCKSSLRWVVKLDLHVATLVRSKTLYLQMLPILSDAYSLLQTARLVNVPLMLPNLALDVTKPGP